MTPIKLSMSEKLGLVGSGFAIAANLVVGAVTNILPGKSKAKTYKLRLVVTMIKSATKFLSARQMQAVIPGTGAMYKAVMRAKGLPVNSVKFEDGTEGHWIGSPEAEVILIFLHGGGYATPASKGHVTLPADAVLKLGAKGESVASLVVEYDLAPGAVYPHQLRQAVHAYKYCVDELNRSSENIILAGDSAGAHLALGLLSCLAHPRSDMPSILNGGSFPSTILVSPWITFDLFSDSIKRNRFKDCLYKPTLKKWSDDFLSQAPFDNYNFPLAADKDWWSPHQDMTLRIIAGQEEMFIDDITRFVHQLREAGLKPYYTCFEDEPHDIMTWGESLGLPTPASKLAFIDWVDSEITRRTI